jgi:uncharacterized protein YndB with AHSA1/START domain
MTTPDVPLRLELSYELPGTAEQVWEAIATANGITAWFIPTDLEEHEGGAVCFHMGEDASSSGTVSGWDPPRRVEFVEPDWAALAGHEPREVGPLVTEFLVEARAGGTCVVRVASSAFGTGADWEREFFADMEKGWRPWFVNLRLVLTDFAGQQVTPLSLAAALPGTVEQAGTAIRQALGAGTAGDPVEVLGTRGRVEHLGDDPPSVLVRLLEPLPGYFTCFAYADGEASTQVALEGKAWLEGLAVPAR